MTRVLAATMPRYNERVSGLVTMIVLVYLLWIAVAVALWAAVSLRRRSTSADSHASMHARGERGTGSWQAADRSVGHDAYRGIRAKRRKTQPAIADPFVVDEGVAEGIASAPTTPGVTRKAPAVRPRDGGKQEPHVDGVRVLDPQRDRNRAADGPAENRAPKEKEDAFERFLRANEEFER